MEAVTHSEVFSCQSYLKYSSVQRIRQDILLQPHKFAFAGAHFHDKLLQLFSPLKFSEGFSSSFLSLIFFLSLHPSVCQASSLCLLSDFHDNTGKPHLRILLIGRRPMKETEHHHFFAHFPPPVVPHAENVFSPSNR